MPMITFMKRFSFEVEPKHIEQSCNNTDLIDCGNEACLAPESQNVYYSVIWVMYGVSYVDSSRAEREYSYLQWLH